MSTSPFHLETVLCEVCGADDAAQLFSGGDRLLGISGRFTVVQCRGCGLAYTNPRPDAASLPFYYPEDYGVYAPEGGQAERLRFYHDRIARRLSRSGSQRPAVLPSAPARVLDIGCGDGTFLELMQQRGWNVTGLEMDERAAERARSRRGLKVVHSTVEDAAFSSGEFDLITLSHLLEHVPHPRTTLGSVRSWLSDEGRIFITLPNVDSWERRFFRDDWYPWDLPRHLFHFSSASLGRLLEGEGFEVTDIRCLNGFFVPQSLRYRRETARNHARELAPTHKPAETRRSAEPSTDTPPSDAHRGISSRTREIFKTAAFRGLLAFADLTGRFVKGEILEVIATKSR